MIYDEQKLKLNAQLNYMELETEGGIAFIQYKHIRNKLFFIHTEVPLAMRKKGIGTALVQKALEYAKKNDLTIIPVCPFVQSYLQKHKEWNNIVAPDAKRFIHNH
jgi:predicted GNAT family acetyltransferase